MAWNTLSQPPELAKAVPLHGPVLITTNTSHVKSSILNELRSLLRVKSSYFFSPGDTETIVAQHSIPNIKHRGSPT